MASVRYSVSRFVGPLLGLGLALVLALQAQQGAVTAPETSELEKRLKDDVKVLASDTMLGRECGTEGERLACEYVCKRFADIGLKPLLPDGAFVQTFEFKRDADSHALTAHNVVGYVDNKAELSVIIGAHYDHIGTGGKSSRSPGKQEVHNGADDNASGVAAMLALADFVKRSALAKNNYLFVAFSAHEQGLFGSEHFLKSGLCDVSKINYMVNLDMVGRLDPDTKRLIIGGSSTCSTFTPILDELAGEAVVPARRELPRGDQSPFVDQKVPFLYFTTGMHDDYHKVTDDVDRIDFSGMVAVIQYIEKTIQALDSKAKLAFNK